MPQMGVSVSEGTITSGSSPRARQSPQTSRCSRSRQTRSTRRCRARQAASCSRSWPRKARRSPSGRRSLSSPPRAPRSRPQAPPEPPTQQAAQEAEEASGAEGEGPAAEAEEAATPAPAPAPRAEPPHAAGRRQRPAGGEVRLAGRRAHRGRAQRRRREHGGHGPRRPRDEEGHPRLHRVRRGRSGSNPRGDPSGGAGNPTAGAGALPPRRQLPAQAQAGRDRRADERHAQGHRRAHAPLARHIGARDELHRGRHDENRGAQAAPEEGVPGGATASTRPSSPSSPAPSSRR